MRNKRKCKNSLINEKDFTKKGECGNTSKVRTKRGERKGRGGEIRPGGEKKEEIQKKLSDEK